MSRIFVRKLINGTINGRSVVLKSGPLKRSVSGPTGLILRVAADFLDGEGGVYAGLNPADFPGVPPDELLNVELERGEVGHFFGKDSHGHILLQGEEQMMFMGRLKGRDILVEGSWLRAWQEHPYEMAGHFLDALYGQEARERSK